MRSLSRTRAALTGATTIRSTAKVTTFLAVAAALTLSSCAAGEAITTPTTVASSTTTVVEPTATPAPVETPAPGVKFTMSGGNVVDIAYADPIPEAVIADVAATALATIPAIQGNADRGDHNRAIDAYTAAVGEQLGRKVIFVEARSSSLGLDWVIDMNRYGSRAEAMDAANKQAAVSVFYVVVPLDYAF
ncbi:MAG: hypothetical protein ACOH2F_09935 [Cellulomonas sp.]